MYGKLFQNEGMYKELFQNERKYWKLFQNEGKYEKLFKTEEMYWELLKNGEMSTSGDGGWGLLCGLGRFDYPENIRKLSGNLGWRARAGKGGR